MTEQITKYAVDSSGNYIGAFVGLDIPEDAIEVPEPPIDSRQKWLGSEWGSMPKNTPDSISRRQCARQMLIMQYITPSEALAMTQNGTPPNMVQQMFDSMPEPNRTLSMIDFAADTYSRSNPLLNQLMLSIGATEDEIDDFFIAAYNL